MREEPEEETILGPNWWTNWWNRKMKQKRNDLIIFWTDRHSTRPLIGVNNANGPIRCQDTNLE